MQGDNPWGGQPSGQSGPYDPSGPYGQPAAPSQPAQPGYGYPGGASQPLQQDSPTYPGYQGYPAGPSQPLYGQPGPYSQPMQGYPGGPSVAVATPPRKGPPLWLWITIGGVVAALILGGIGTFVGLSLYGAPGAAAAQFCTDLKTQNYDSAYNMLSAKLRGQYTTDQFHQANGALDTAEGKVSACGAAQGSGSYDYSLGRSTATVVAVVTRDKQGSLQGGVHLVNESGGWKVDGIDTSLLGVNLGALQALGAFCAAMQAQNYTTAFGLLSSALQTQDTQDGFVAISQLHDQIDGNVTACGLSAVATGNTDTATTVTVSITRSKLGASTGPVSLDGTGGTWKISKIDAAVQGSDVGPFVTGTLFCAALVANAYPVAYSLLSTAFQQAVSQTVFTQVFTGLLTKVQAGAKWTGCTPDLTTYKVTGTQAQFTNRINLASATGVALGDYKFVFVFVKEGAVWKIDDLQ